MKKTICYYHKIDLDGKCSAAIVRRRYPDCELIGVDYPDRPDFERIENGDRVIVVDFSFALCDMDKLFSGGLLVWIDHHESALNVAYLGKYADCAGARKVGKAGCELTWEYFFPEEPMPEAVRLLGRYDVWDKSNIEVWEKEILPFQYGMRLTEWAPDSDAWLDMLAHNDYAETPLDHGLTVLAYEGQRNATYSAEMAFPVEFEGYDSWAINKALSNSKIFDTLDPFGERPLYILFNYKKGVWKYSLYCNPDSGIDVSKIAVKYGGGGHAGAARFKSDKYLLKEV